MKLNYRIRPYFKRALTSLIIGCIIAFFSTMFSLVKSPANIPVWNQLVTTGVCIVAIIYFFRSTNVLMALFHPPLRVIVGLFSYGAIRNLIIHSPDHAIYWSLLG